MAKKNRPHNPPKPPQFAVTPFCALKGVTVTDKPAPVIPPPIKAKPPAQPAENDAELFLEAMAGAIRMHAAPETGKAPAGAAKSRQETRPVISAEETRAAELFREEIGRLKLEVKFAEQLPDEDELKPMSGNRLKLLKRGIITVDHQLDLHGLTRDEALAELPRFLRSAQLRQQAAALVITGKGYNSPGEPVLQQAVAAWLREAGRGLVMEFAPAPREMGGSGAFVVFLRPLPPPPVAAD